MRLAGLSSQRSGREVWRNWSNSHSYTPKLVHRPATTREVDFILQLHNSLALPLAVVGAGLSPNGLAFGSSAPISSTTTVHALSIENMNQMLSLDVDQRTAKFQCGMTIQDVLDELRPHGLMLENLASINLQQLGGFYSIGAHGTGRLIPPVEEQILALTLVTPGRGVLELDAVNNQPDLFHMCKLGLGLCGVVTDVTVRLVDRYRMKQTKQVLQVATDLSKQQFSDLVMGNEHVKFMWIPHTGATVACYSNRTDDEEEEEEEVATGDGAANPLQAMRALYREFESGKSSSSDEANFADLRAMLLKGKSLDVAAVKRINLAELDFHKQTQGQEVGWAEKYMAFDCGGAQLVFEFCIKFDEHECRDYDLVRALLAKIEQEQFPAPGPIEHRFSASSRARMSPAYSGEEEGAMFSWIGVVMYLPQGDDAEEIKLAFDKYCDLVRRVCRDVGIVDDDGGVRVHWGKLEVPWEDEDKAQAQRDELRKLYPVDEFNRVREELDPNHVLQTGWSLAVFGR